MEKESQMPPFNLSEKEEKMNTFLGDKERIVKLAEEFRQSKEIDGTAQEFINLSSAFVRNDDYRTACEILRAGIDRYPFDVDLLACFLDYATDSGVSIEISKCDMYYMKLKEISLTRYSSQALNATLKYLSVVCKNSSQNDFENIKEEAKEILEVFCNLYSNSEDSYFARCNFVNGDEEKKILLREAVSKFVSCPKCSLKLADILCDQGIYDEACKVLEKCLHSVQALPKVNSAYVYYLFGICKYGSLINNDSSFNDSEALKTSVEKIYEAFRIAKSEHHDLRQSYKKEIEKIIYILEQQTQIAYS